VDTAVSEFDEKEHVEAAQRDRLDREEVAREHARKPAGGGNRASSGLHAWGLA